MSGAALGLVLVAAACHAVWNIAAKRASGDGYVFVWWYNLFSALVWLPIGVVTLARAGWPWSWGLLVGPLVSAVLHIGYQLCLQTGYDRADLGVVYPVARGIGPLLTMLVALAAFHERPGWSAVLGGAVVIAGIVVVATGRRAGAVSTATPASTASAASADGGRAPRRPVLDGLAWGAATGATIAAYTLWDDHAMTSLAPLPVAYFASCCGWQVLLLTPGLRGREALRPALTRNRAEVAVVALLSPLAYILVLQAMRTTPVSLVAPARESSIVVGALLGWWLFREPDPLRRLLGAAIVLAGIVLVVH